MKELFGLLVCPVCNAEGREFSLVSSDEHTLKCPECDSVYPVIGEKSFRIIKPNVGDVKITAAAFWGDIYQQLYSNTESLSKSELNKYLLLLEEYFKKLHHLAVTEVNLSSLAGKVVLEVGSGSGAHSALFRKHGAHVISVDLTPERVVSTQRMLSNVDGGNGDYLCLNADAENIPLLSNSVDMVYSNGVLHHSPSTEKCISEVFRVLKPGATSAMMLYCRTSALFFTLWFWYGLLNGSRFNYPEEEWLGRITEGVPLNQEEFNPVTRVYSRSQLIDLLSEFGILSLRKNSFDFGHFLPRGNGILNNLIQKITRRRKHPGGFLVYGNDGIVQSDFERLLSRAIGFDWNILIKKPLL